MSQIYLIEFTNGALYIGSSIRPKTRHYEHLRDLKRGSHHSAYLQRSYDKGYDFSFVVLEETEIDDPQELQKMEAVWISVFDAIHCREFANTQQPLGLEFGKSAKSKPCVLFKNDTSYLFSSPGYAAKSLKISHRGILNLLCENCQTHKGYYGFYLNSDKGYTINPKTKQERQSKAYREKPVVSINKKTGEEVLHKSFKEASEFCGCPSCHISNILDTKNARKSSYGYTFREPDITTPV